MWVWHYEGLALCRLPGPRPEERAGARRTGHAKQDDTASRSRGAWRPSFSIHRPSSETEGAGKTGCPSHPWSACNKKARGRTTGTSRTTGLPCAMVLTVSFVLSPVRPGFVVTVRATPKASSRPRQCAGALRGAPASGRQDHTTSPSAIRHSSRDVSRPSHPAANVRDDREAPLLRQRDARDDRCDLPDEASEIVHDGHFAHGGNAPERELCRYHQGLNTRPLHARERSRTGAGPSLSQRRLRP
jgi:hypothetical protein